jgi:hypothetical protein
MIGGLRTPGGTPPTDPFPVFVTPQGRCPCCARPNGEPHMAGCPNGPPEPTALSEMRDAHGPVFWFVLGWSLGVVSGGLTMLALAT